MSYIFLALSPKDLQRFVFPSPLHVLHGKIFFGEGIKLSLFIGRITRI